MGCLVHKRRGHRLPRSVLACTHGAISFDFFILHGAAHWAEVGGTFNNAGAGRGTGGLHLNVDTGVIAQSLSPQGH